MYILIKIIYRFVEKTVRNFLKVNCLRIKSEPPGQNHRGKL